MLDSILVKAPIFLLVFVRCFGMVLTLPMFSMRAVSRIAKVALCFYVAFFLMNTVNYAEYEPFLTDDGVFSMDYILLAIGEGLIGVIMGFFITIIFAAFSSAGQFIAFQMGLSAASSYDSLSQVENPLMGQFFNLVAMLVFIQTKWYQKLFLGILGTSFKAVNAVTLVAARESFVKLLLHGLTNLFADALIISLPIMGTLLLISVCTGLLTKAAPQMNLLSEGFPVMILVAFCIIRWVFPNVIDFFGRSFQSNFSELENFFASISGGIK